MASSSSSVNELFVQHQRDIFAFILTLVPDRNDAEDVYQQTCLALLEKQSDYDPQREFLPWAFGFALNEVRRFRRAHYRERLQLNDEAIDSLADVQFKSAKRLNAQLELLLECLRSLSAAKQELLMQSYAYHGRLKELAGILQIDVNTLYKRLERIRRSLLECIERGQ